MKNVVVLISGSGSNLQAIMDAAAQAGSYTICGVLSNRADAYGLTRAELAGIPTEVVNHQSYPDRQSFDDQLIKQIDEWQADREQWQGPRQELSFLVNRFHRPWNRIDRR